MFHVGQLVVCVKEGQWIGGTGDETDPVRGTVYTVRHSFTFGVFAAIRLVEIANRPGASGIEVCYDARRFRPVDPQRLSTFRKALTPKKEMA